ncbi:MAG: RagB/SusD family nutrient uptake outer membrane protein, partial [Sphingobacteriales bacterium]
MNRKILIAGVAFTLLTSGCTKLEEKYNANIITDPSTGSSPNVGNLLTAVYNSMREPFQNQERMLGLWEMTTDALIGPTRGPDWDDNGVWRVLHAHQFNADNIRILQTFNDMGSTVFQATDLLRYNPSPAQSAQARFIRAMANFIWLDGWDQVPHREPGESAVQPAKVRKGIEALDYIIAEINAVMPNLPDPSADKSIANKDAARVLLMKCYLNKGVYENRQTPSFAAADMNQVITLADQIINSNRYSFASNYYDNFAPNNDAIGRENIWTHQNIGGNSSGPVRSRWHAVMHYNQYPSGWNGFSTLADFYSKFEANDVRIGTAYPTNSTVYTNPGNRRNIGFLEGQQYDLRNNTPLQDRKGQPLSFSKEVDIIEKTNDLERRGIRPYKYAIDYPNADNGNWDNDYVYFRLADVLLMKAEAVLRGGTATTAGTYGSTPAAIVNAIRTNRGASVLPTVTLDNLIDERGRELYLENWRRQDLIRFGKFLAPREEKPETSDPKYLLFPIPSGQIASNPNLTQNPG